MKTRTTKKTKKTKIERGRARAAHIGWAARACISRGANKVVDNAPGRDLRATRTAEMFALFGGLDHVAQCHAGAEPLKPAHAARALSRGKARPLQLEESSSRDDGSGRPSIRRLR